MQKLFNFLLACAIILISGCSGTHLINNKEYRSNVESSFKEREQLAQNRKDKLFNVFGSGLSLQQEEALKFLFAYMPLSDLADYNGDFFLANANIALKTRKESTWGKSIPEEIFLHYVLPLGIYGEELDSFRIAYYDEIQDRVKGMDAKDAALEINHWCHEKVGYQTSVWRNGGPVNAILSAGGRCGQLSIFTVASLRTAGIPARYVHLLSLPYTDSWDHAWVEVWIDGKWYYMEASGPEPVLDKTWFTEPARRAMLINTYSFGAKYGQENAIVCYRNFSVVNALSKYAVTKQINVKVLDTNNIPVKDALVEYLLYVSAQFDPIAEVPTDEFGISQFETGLGDLLIWARKGDDFNFKKVSVADIDTINLILNLKPADNGFQELDLGVPIARVPLKGPAIELITANTKRINEDNMIRQVYIDSWMKPEEAANLAKELGLDPVIVKDIISKSMGNYKNIASFLIHTPVSDRSLAIDLLKQLSDQDLRTTKEEIFADHLNNVIRFENTNGAYDYELYSKYVLNPSIGNRMIFAWRKYLFESMPTGFRQDAINDPSILIKYVNNNIVIDDSKDYYNPSISPKGVDELKVSDSFSRNNYFVALCRSLGIPSRLGNVPQFYFKNEWHDVWLAGKNQPLPRKGFVRFSSGEKNPVPEYYTHFTIAHFENGHYNTIISRSTYKIKVTNFKDELALAPGHYMLVTGNRINDSKILAALSFFELKENEHKVIDIKLRKDVSPAEIFGTIDLNMKISLPDKSGITLKRIADKGIVLVWIDPDKEATKHLFSDLLLLKPELDNWGGYFIFLSNQPEASNNFKLESIKGLPANSLYSVDIDSKILKEITKSVSLSDIHYPFLVLADNNGNIILKSAGYRIGTGEQILKKIGYELSGNDAFPSSKSSSWTAVNTGLKYTSVDALTVIGTNLFAGTYGNGAFLSTNNGTSWSAVNAGITSTNVSTFAVCGTNLFAGTDNGVFLSTNNGTNWTAVNNGLTNTSVHAFAMSGTNLFAGTDDGGVFLSTNNGTSWTKVKNVLIPNSVHALVVSGINLFAGTNGGGVFLSTNNGTNWTAVNNGLTNTRVLALAVSGTNLFAGTEGGGVFLSTNNGTSWTATGLTNHQVQAFAISGTNLFAGTEGGGVFLSTNNGSNWTEIGLTGTDVCALAISGTNLFAGTWSHGILRRPISDIINAAKGVK